MPTHEQETIIPFAPAPTSTTSGNADQLDRAGQTILQLLNTAAGVAEQNSRNAIELAQGLSNKLRAAEGRIAELEAQAAAYQEQAKRAEQWLHQVYTEIEDRFLRQDQNARRGCVTKTWKRHAV
jgi:TolA-binding protein